MEELWQKDLKNQEDVHFSYDIITVNRELGVAHWDASFTRVSSGVRDELDGVFVVSLDDQGLCTEFRQWWVVKPRE